MIKAEDVWEAIMAGAQHRPTVKKVIANRLNQARQEQQEADIKAMVDWMDKYFHGAPNGVIKAIKLALYQEE